MSEPRTSPSPPQRRTNLRALLAVVPFLLLVTVVPGGAMAAPPSESVSQVHAAVNCNGNATCALDATLQNVQYFLIGIAVLLAGVAFAIYGIQYMLGSLDEMDPQKKIQRKKQAISIVVGLVTVLLSVVLVSVAQGLIVTA